jgi:small subunit ribosomal protein S13
MRIAGISIPEKKRLEIGLQEVYGIGRTRARSILENAGVSFDERPTALGAEKESKIRKLVENHLIEGNLRREISSHIKRLKDTLSYRGVRHRKNLPVRGQRTKTNSRTTRGNTRRTMGSGKRKLEKK